MAAHPGLSRRLAPAGCAAALAVAYVVLAPPSTDLSAQLYRAHLFSTTGFAVWDNRWYSGHSLPGYSVLAPAVFSLLGARLAAGLAAVGSAVTFDRFVHARLGPRAWLGSLLFAAATAISLYTGRLTLALGLWPALAAVAALDRGRPVRAGLAGCLAALLSPVAALFCAIAAAGLAGGEIGHRGRLRAGLAGGAVALAALAPVGLVALAFPETGTEPFAVGTLLPLVAVCLGAWWAAPPAAAGLRAGILLYLATVVAAFLVPSPVGGNVARLGTLLAAPLAGLLWSQRHPRRLAVLLVPLLYVGWQAPVRDTTEATADPAARPGYDAPLVRFLAGQPGVFRTEVVFTARHGEALWVARRFALARGWERQTDRADNPLFYGGRLTPAAYRRWLWTAAVRFVALPDAALDPSARGEARLVRDGLPYLREVMRSAHWRVYAVRDAAGLASAGAVVTELGSDSLTIRVPARGRVLLHVHYTPYWTLQAGAGCVGPARSGLTRLWVPGAETVRLAARFSLGRIGTDAPVCAGPRPGPRPA